MDGDSCIRKAYESILHGEFDGAIEWFRQAIQLDPDNASYHYKCSVSCSRSGRWELALHHARQACLLDPQQPEYKFHLDVVEARRLTADATLLLAAGPSHASEALLFAQEARELDPLSADASYAAARCSAALNRIREARAFALEACRLDPAHEEARELLRELRKRMRT